MEHNVGSFSPFKGNNRSCCFVGMKISVKNHYFVMLPDFEFAVAPLLLSEQHPFDYKLEN